MRHPKGTRARVLLSSVFKPFAQDDEFGSRVINPVELYHNQVTRAQGPFSLRMFHRSWGLMFIHQNISAPCTLLDFPYSRALRRGADRARLRCRGHLVDRRQCRQGPRDVPARAAALSALHDCRRRSRDVDAGHREEDRRRSHRARRRGGMDARVPGRGFRPSVRASADSVLVRLSDDGRAQPARGRQPVGDDRAVGRVSTRLQFLHDIGLLWWKGEVRQPAGGEPWGERADPDVAVGYRARVWCDDLRDQSRRRPCIALGLEA